MQRHPHQPPSLRTNGSEAPTPDNLTPRSRTSTSLSSSARPTFRKHIRASLALSSPITTSSGPLTSHKAAITPQISPPRDQASRLLPARRNRQTIRTASTSRRSATDSSYSKTRISTRLKWVRPSQWVLMFLTSCRNSQEGPLLGTRTAMVAASKL